jgi:hypothetical protein
MSKFKVEFTLKQHTPLIHFQADQSGATLRATELKPKFDRFLKEYVLGGSFDRLNYKVKIIGSNYEKYTYKTYVNPKKAGKYDRVGAYFGNLKAIKFQQNIRIEFFSFNADVIEKIREYFADFISITNFGARQNKGFGSFSVVKIDDKEITFDEKRLLRYYPKIYKTNSADPLKKILEDYQYLKSGTNRPYKKSLLFEYMCKNNVRWEKRMIKEYLKKDFPSIFENLKYEKEPIKCKNEQNFEYQYIRGLLGITEQIEFLKRDARNFRDKIKIQIKSKDKSIERFKSPITYKVINNNIYVLAVNEIPVKGKEFIFKVRGERGKLYKPIKIPQDFDIFKFLDFALANKLSYTILKS